MTVLAEELNRHVKGARKVLSTWEKTGLTGRSIAESIQMINEELTLLNTMASAHPRRAKGLKRLADRYRQLLAKLSAH